METPEQKIIGQPTADLSKEVINESRSVLILVRENDSYMEALLSKENSAEQAC